MNEELRPSIPSNVPKWMIELIKEMWQHDPNKRIRFNECIKIIESKGEIKLNDIKLNRIINKKSKKKNEIIKVIIENERSIKYIGEEKYKNNIIWIGYSGGILSGINIENFNEIIKKDIKNDGITSCYYGMKNKLYIGGKDGSLNIIDIIKLFEKKEEIKKKEENIVSSFYNNWFSNNNNNNEKEDDNIIKLFKFESEIIDIILLSEFILSCDNYGNIILLSKKE